MRFHKNHDESVITYEFLVRNFNKRVAGLAAACTFKAELGDTGEGHEIPQLVLLRWAFIINLPCDSKYDSL